MSEQQSIADEPNRANAVRLFLCGFLILFLELVLIRYLAGNIWNLGYFPNPPEPLQVRARTVSRYRRPVESRLLRTRF